ncbi:MAG TPA: hypothetical protein VK666_25915 [Chryseolinea sp.]|nr:hypothetical protein [Chryseolinea sp.]
MRKLVLLIFIAFLSCKEISYKAPQPRGKTSLHEVPAALLGAYVLVNDKDNSKDTLVINSRGYLVLSDNKQKSIGDSLVLKSYKGYYFVSVNENPEWLLRILRPEGNGDITFMSMKTDESSFNDLLRNLSKDVTIDSVVIDNEKLYQIDPSPGQLLKLIKKGYFSETSRMVKVKSQPPH